MLVGVSDSGLYRKALACLSAQLGEIIRLPAVKAIEENGTKQLRTWLCFAPPKSNR